MTGLALGGMAVVGAIQARKNAQLKKKLDAVPLAPPPVPAPAALTTPTPSVMDPGVKQSLGNVAALKQRKKAAGGSLLTNPKPPKSNTMPVPGSTMPKSLVAGY